MVLANTMARFCSVPDVGGHDSGRFDYACVESQGKRCPTKRKMWDQEAKKVKGDKNNMKPQIEEKSLC